MTPENKRTKRAIVLLLLVVAVILLLFRFSSYRTVVHKISIEAPAGTYITFLPSASSGGRTIVLHLAADTKQTAIFTQDYRNQKPPIVKTGTWQKVGERDILVTLPDEKLKFTIDDTKIILDQPDDSQWGGGGLELDLSLLELPSEWMWVDTQLPGGVTHAPQRNTSFVMTLGADMKVSVIGDCNSLSGSFTLYDEADASFAVTTGTKKACQDSVEALFLSDINRTTAYAVDADTLTLSLEGDTQGYGTMTFVRVRTQPSQDDDGKGIAVGEIPPGTTPGGGEPPVPAPSPAPEPQPTPVPSMEKTYTLVSYNDKEVSSPEAYTLTLSDTTIGARFCNSMGGTYETKGSQISAQLISTMMFCEQPQGLMDMETAFSAMLSRGAELTVEGNMLTLRDGKTTLVYREQQDAKQR